MYTCERAVSIDNERAILMGKSTVEKTSRPLSASRAGITISCLERRDDTHKTDGGNYTNVNVRKKRTPSGPKSRFNFTIWIDKAL